MTTLTAMVLSHCGTQPAGGKYKCFGGVASICVPVTIFCVSDPPGFYSSAPQYTLYTDTIVLYKLYIAYGGFLFNLICIKFVLDSSYSDQKYFIKIVI